MTEHEFVIDQRTYHIYDVGGQRSLRLYWAPYFDHDIHAILFVSSLACYDQILMEDPSMNRMRDAIELFRDIVTNELLKKTCIILFLNKLDLLERKMKHAPIQWYFSDFPSEECTLRSATQYFKHAFLSQQEGYRRRLYCHFTTSTDTHQMSVIIHSVT